MGEAQGGSRRVRYRKGGLVGEGREGEKVWCGIACV